MGVYFQHFGLKREPFSIVPDPNLLFPSYQHRQAVAHLKYGLDREGGFVVLTGEVGTGKTTLTRTIIEHLPAHIRVAYILNSKLKEADLFASICKELSIKFKRNSHLSYAKQCSDAIYDNLLQAHSEGLKTLIILEEAQNLDDEILESLRLLSNLETNSSKLLHILLVGQPELTEKLAQNNLRQLNQRVVSRFHLLPLKLSEIPDYINYRLAQAGAIRELFDRRSYRYIFKLTKGVPRLINLVCHQALLAAYSESKQSVNASLVIKSSAEVLGKKTRAFRSKAWRIGIFIFLSLSILMFFFREELQREIATDKSKYNYQGKFESNLFQEEKQNNISLARPLKTSDANQSVERVSSSINPIEYLFSLWGHKVEGVFTEEALNSAVRDIGLKYETDEFIDFEVVLKTNRPGIVHLTDSDSNITSAVLLEVREESILLFDLNGKSSIKLEIFLERWTGSFSYLWAPPKQFKVLKFGDENKDGLVWLQDKLTEIYTNKQRLITGGRFTQAVFDEIVLFQKQNNIKPDGIVGRRTIMLINQLTNEDIPLIIQESG